MNFIGNMMNRVGNLLHIGHDSKDKSKRRESISVAAQGAHRGSVSVGN
jgi:hypothetical protein